MAKRLISPFLLLGAFLSLGASTYTTPNFVVTAPNAQIAKQVGQYAEQYRRQKAIEWIGREMQQWPEPCPLKVTITMSGSGGATTFGYDRNQVVSRSMHIEGTLERLLASVLPHEVTHTVFAEHFRQPVPRWADEGGSVLSEDELERKRHDKLVRSILNNGRAMPLRRLLSLRDYPRDVMVLYAEGFSVTDFLVARSSRPAFLNFVADGMKLGWDQAAQAHYGFRSVEDLEQAWLQHLRDTKERPPAEVAQAPAPWKAAASSQEIVVRQTAPPVQPLDDWRGGTARGAAPRPDDLSSRPFRPTGKHPAEASLPPVPALPPIPAATLGAPVVRLGAPEYPDD